MNVVPLNSYLLYCVAVPGLVWILPTLITLAFLARAKTLDRQAHNRLTILSLYPIVGPLIVAAALLKGDSRPAA